MSNLTGRVALVTGVSRPIGIAATIAQRLHEEGATVIATGWPPHDAEMPWGEQPIGARAFPVRRDDLSDAAVPPALVHEVATSEGRIDIIVATHARSSHLGFGTVTVDELDRCWSTNVRSIIQLGQALAEHHTPAGPDRPPLGRLMWFTSGQAHGPMDGELAYAVSKGALHQMTSSVDHALERRRIIANCINPGPVDTGYASGEFHQTVAGGFPDQRWGTPADIANVVGFLASDAGCWIRGQVLNVDGGYSYHA